MSLFVCTTCGGVDNTALTRYWFRKGEPLCNPCDPEIPSEAKHNRQVASWDGEVVLNPDVIDRFVRFKAVPDKCSHASLGKPGIYHVGAIKVCKDCGIHAELVHDGSKEETERGHQVLSKTGYSWSLTS